MSILRATCTLLPSVGVMVSKLNQLHFQAIWINRNGYEDRGALLLSQLKSLGLRVAIKDKNILVIGLNKSES